MSSPPDSAIARHRDQPTSASSRVGTLLVMAGAIAIIASAGVTFAGHTPAPLVLVAVLLCSLAVGQATSWLEGILTTVLGMLAGLAVLMRAYPVVGLPLAQSNTIALVVLSAGALVALGRARTRLRLPDRSATTVGVSALLVPLGALAAMATIIIRSGGTKISWSMNNDATFSLMIARFMVKDAGDDPDKHLTMAPLTYEVMAAFIAPGRSSTAGSALLAHDVHRVIQVLLLLLVAMSVLGAVAVGRAVPRERVWSRIALTLVMGAVPWTWFVSGFAWKYGFHNALLAGVLVTSVWIAWVLSRTHPTRGTAWQALAATALLATWAPLVLVPLALGGFLLVRSWRAHAALRGVRLLVWLVPVLGFLWYALFTTLPVFQKVSSVLAANGAMFGSHPANAVAILIIALAVTMLGTIGRRASWQVTGVLIVGVAGTIGAVYLVAQRVDDPVGLWGYYPAKYAWLLAMAGPLVCARAFADRLGEPRASRTRRAGLVAVCGLTVTVVMAQLPPVDLRTPSLIYAQQRPTPNWTPASVIPMISIADKYGMSDMDGATKDLLRISDPDRKVFVLRYSTDLAEDTYINYWLLWQQFDEFPLINGARGYDLVKPEDPLGAACAIVKDWGGGVEILTREPTLERNVRQTCPRADISFTLAPPATD